MSRDWHEHMTQRVAADPYWRVNCSAYTAAMAINDSALGGIAGVSGAAVRRYSNEPIPDPASPGLNLKQVIAVAKNEYRVNLADRTGNTWAFLMARLSEHRRILLQVEYLPLGGFRCQANGDFGHMLLLIRDSGPGRLEASDPLCTSSKQYSESTVRAAAEAFAATHSNNKNALWWAMTRPIPRVA